MTHEEFVESMIYMATACGLYRDNDHDVIPAPTLRAYWDCLHDLPADVFRDACRLAALEHRVSTLPTVGAIRQKAADLMCPLPSVDEAVKAIIAAAKGQKLPKVYQEFARTCIGAKSNIGMRKQQEAEDYVRFKWLAYVKEKRQAVIEPPKLSASKRAIQERFENQAAIPEKPRSQPKPQRRIEQRTREQITDAAAVVKSATEPVKRPQKTADEQLRGLAKLQSKGTENQ